MYNSFRAIHEIVCDIIILPKYKFFIFKPEEKGDLLLVIQDKYRGKSALKVNENNTNSP